jgi:hypothetical protein
MKNLSIKSILMVVTILFLVTACKKDLIMFDSSMNVVGFSSSSITVRENLGGSAPVMLYLGAADGTQPTNVTLSVDTVGFGALGAKEGIDFTLSAKSVSLSVGETPVNITPIDNSVFTGNKKFYLVIVSNSNNYRISAQKRILVTLNDDEHPLKKWIGTYLVTAVSYGDPVNWDEEWTVITSAIDGDVTQLSLKGVGSATSNPIIATLNTTDMTISIEPGQSLGDPYGAGPVSVFLGTADLVFFDTAPLVGTILENGNIMIDFWGEKVMEGEYAGPWDVFNTTWTKQ